MLERVKKACRLAEEDVDFDDELTGLIEQGKEDLLLAGVCAPAPGEAAASYERAVILFARMNFGSPDDYDRLKRAYDECKAQLQLSSLYGLREAGE